MNTQPSTAVLIHGCHLEANLNGSTWEDIVWGSDSCAPTFSGRAVMGLYTALLHKASLIIFPTGASERAKIKEGQFTQEYLYNRIPALVDLFRGTPCAVDEPTLRSLLNAFSELDLVSQNTSEECERNLRLCIEHGIERVILVSSPWHIQRCLTEALRIAQSMRDAGESVPEIMAVASHGSTEDIVILEPPHRGDRPKTKFHLLARRFFRLGDDQLPAFERNLDRLLDENGV